MKKKKAIREKVAGTTQGVKAKKPGEDRKQYVHREKTAAAFSPDPLKRDLVRQTIITVLWRKEEVTEAVLFAELNREIGKHFDEDLLPYLTLVKDELMQWKLMEVLPGKKVAYYRLAQKLDKKDDD